MSKFFRIAVVAEGPTDILMIEYALTAIWGNDISFTCTMIQPEERSQNIFGTKSSHPEYENPGWGGIYKWCQNLAQKKMPLDIFKVAELQFDILVIQLDSDVLCFSYGDYSLPQNPHAQLPLKIESTYVQKASILPNYVKRWLYPVKVSSNTIFCIPAQTLETWLYVGKDPRKNYTTANRNIEERDDFKTRNKTPRIFKKLKNTLIANWPYIESQCTQAKKFGDAIRAYPV